MESATLIGCVCRGESVCVPYRRFPFQGHDLRARRVCSQRASAVGSFVSRAPNGTGCSRYRT
eukprot:7361749-Prymnesium_polylepis.1